MSVDRMLLSHGVTLPYGSRSTGLQAQENAGPAQNPVSVRHAWECAL